MPGRPEPLEQPAPGQRRQFRWAQRALLAAAACNGVGLALVFFGDRMWLLALCELAAFTLLILVMQTHALQLGVERRRGAVVAPGSGDPDVHLCLYACSRVCDSAWWEAACGLRAPRQVW